MGFPLERGDGINAHAGHRHSTPRSSPLEPPRQGIHHEHRVRASQSRNLKNEQPDRAGAKDDNGIPHPDPGQVHGVDGHARAVRAKPLRRQSVRPGHGKHDRAGMSIHSQKLPPSG